MKRLKKAAAVIVAFILCIFVFGCTPAEKYDDGECRVVITEGVGFVCRSPVLVMRRGGDASFVIELDDGYVLSRVDYVKHTLVPSPEDAGVVTLTLHEVRYSVAVEITAELADPRYTVTLNPDEAFSCETPEQRAAHGQDVGFTLVFKEGYCFGGFKEKVLYDERGADLSSCDGGRSVEITVRNVTQSSSLTVIPVEAGQSVLDGYNPRIRYDTNGGRIKGSDKTRFSSGYIPVPNRRPNTHTGAELVYREGYVLCGWNTRADGTGVKIGLGSRYGGASALFAEWSKNTAESCFTYGLIDADDVCRLYAEEDKKTLSELERESVSEDKVAIISGYNGGDKRLTVPERLGGYPVAGISERAFENAKFETAVLPRGIEYVADFAFLYCDGLKELCLSDDIVFFSENAMGYNPRVSTLRINAVLPPAYIRTENGQVANKLELLETCESEKPKLILFAGCSVWYGLDANYAYDLFGGRYEVFNMGVIGGVCALYQIALISSYLKSGDMFVHNPEPGAVHQLFVFNNFDARVFATLECNYDFVASLDLTAYDDVWKGFSKYLTGKLVYMSGDDFVPSDYSDGLDYMDARGNNVSERRGGFDNEGLAYEILSIAQFENSLAKRRLYDCYSALSGMGVGVFVGFGPVNSDGLDYSRGYELERAIRAAAGDKAVVYMTFDDCVMDKEYFYDTNYHPSTAGSKIYTERVVQRLKNQIK